MTTFKDRVRRAFDKQARAYDSAVDIQPIIARNLFARMNALPAPVRTILEVGCGTGFLSELLVEQFPDSQLVLTDIAPEMCAICADRFSSSGNIRIECMDAETMRRNAKFDLIASSMVFHWFQDCRFALQQLFNQLNSGGSLIFAMLGGCSLREWSAACQLECGRSPALTFRSVDELKSWFPEMELESEVLTKRYEDALEFVKNLKQFGGATPNAEHRALSAGALRRTASALSRDSKDGVSISYEVIYGRIQKR